MDLHVILYVLRNIKREIFSGNGCNAVSNVLCDSAALSIPLRLQQPLPIFDESLGCSLIGHVLQQHVPGEHTSTHWFSFSLSIWLRVKGFLLQRQPEVFICPDVVWLTHGILDH